MAGRRARQSAVGMLQKRRTTLTKRRRRLVAHTYFPLAPSPRRLTPPPQSEPASRAPKMPFLFRSPEHRTPSPCRGRNRTYGKTRCHEPRHSYHMGGILSVRGNNELFVGFAPTGMTLGWHLRIASTITLDGKAAEVTAILRHGPPAPGGLTVRGSRKSPTAAVRWRS